MASKVYVLYDKGMNQVKVGQSVDPGDRLHQIRDNHPQAEIVARYPAKNGRDAESRAQQAVRNKGLSQIGSSDWFGMRPHVSMDQILKAVQSGVQSSNDRY